MKELFITALLQFVTPNRHKLARYTWNKIDNIMDCEPYWNLLASRYLNNYNPTAEEINAIIY